MYHFFSSSMYLHSSVLSSYLRVEGVGQKLEDWQYFLILQAVQEFVEVVLCGQTLVTITQQCKSLSNTDNNNEKIGDKWVTQTSGFSNLRVCFPKSRKYLSNPFRVRLEVKVYQFSQ